MLETVRPRAFMPVHGEYRMLLAHARIAEETGVPAHAVRIADNGTVLELDAEGLASRARSRPASCSSTGSTWATR